MIGKTSKLLSSESSPSVTISFHRKLLELQDKPSTLRINFLPQKKDEESWNLVLHARILWCRAPTLLHLCLFVIDDNLWLPLMIVTYYMLPGLHLNQSLYKFGKARIFHSLISFLNEHLNLQDLLVNIKVSRTLHFSKDDDFRNIS